MKKIMHVIYGLNTGGAEALVKEYSLKMNKNLFEVVILCYEHHDVSPYETILKNNNIRIIYVCDSMKYYKSKIIFSKVINYIQKYLITRRYICNEKPDIIHTHLFVNSYIRFAKPKLGTKIFHTVHNEPKVLWRKNKFSRRMDFKAAKWLVKKYNMRFIVLHENMKKEVDLLFNVTNSVVLNNGIDFSRFNKDKNRVKKREELGIPDNSYVVGHVGRFSYQKNHDFLVDVFCEIIKDKKNAFLLMIGNGREKERIISKLHDLNLDNNYLILSDRNDIPDLLNAMDCFVFPSRFEGLGISLIEAQKIKLPCFISDNVPDQAIISNLVTKISLDVNPLEWKKKILKYNYPKKVVLDDEEWDMDNVVQKLGCIYLDKI